MTQALTDNAKIKLVADQNAWSLPAWTYYDQEFFELER